MGQTRFHYYVFTFLITKSGQKSASVAVFLSNNKPNSSEQQSQKPQMTAKTSTDTAVDCGPVGQP